MSSIKWAGGEDDTTRDLVYALVNLRVAKRQALEIREVPPRADKLFAKSGSRKGKVRA